MGRKFLLSPCNFILGILNFLTGGFWFAEWHFGICSGVIVGKRFHRGIWLRCLHVLLAYLMDCIGFWNGNRAWFGLVSNSS